MGTRLTTRQVLTDPLVMGTIAVTVFLSGMFLTATPLLFAELADEALLEAVASPEPQLRNLTASSDLYMGAFSPSDPFRRVEERGLSFRDQQMPSSIQSLIDDVAWVVDSPQFVVEAMPGSEDGPEYTGSRFAGTLLQMRYQQGIDSRMTLTEGSLPQFHHPITVELGADCPLTGQESEEDEVDCRDVELAVFEIAVTREMLDFLGVDVGGMVLLSPDLDDGAYFGVPLGDFNTTSRPASRGSLSSRIPIRSIGSTTRGCFARVSGRMLTSPSYSQRVSCRHRTTAGLLGKQGPLIGHTSGDILSIQPRLMPIPYPSCALTW